MLSLRGARFDQPARFTVLERAKAARASGLTSLGLEYYDPSMTPAVLDYVTVPELEWVDVDREVPAATVEHLLTVAGMLGSTRINAGVGIGTKSPVPLEEVTGYVSLFAAAVAPLTVALEPIAFGWLPHARDVAKIVTDVNMPNLGFLLDMWHISADAEPYVLDVASIAEVQLAGIPATYGADMFAGAMDRPLITDSSVDIGAWMTHLESAGYAGPVSYEAPHARNASMRLSMIARNVADDIASIA